MTNYLLLFAIVLGVNLLPAFGPPSWSIVALYGLNSSLSLPVIVVVAALAAALGRYALAHGFRLLRHHIPARMKANLEAAGNALQRRKRHAVLALGLLAWHLTSSKPLIFNIVLASELTRFMRRRAL